MVSEVTDPEPILPLPREEFEGDIVIASIWIRDIDPPITALLMLLRSEPPYYEVAEIEWVRDRWEKTPHFARHPNINPATEYYADQGGDY